MSYDVVSFLGLLVLIMTTIIMFCLPHLKHGLPSNSYFLLHTGNSVVVVVVTITAAAFVF